MKSTVPFIFAKNFKPNALILHNDWDRATNILLNYIEKITDTRLNITEVYDVRPFIIFDKVDHGKSGFAYYMDNKDIRFEAGNEQAAVYAVYDFLERIVGCRYYTKNEEYIPRDCNLSVMFDYYKFNPILEYREVYYKGFNDKEFAEKHKMTAMNDHKDWGFWCHSFETLIPTSEYYDEHPEYFAYVNGKRIKEHTQPCLTNPKVFDIVVENLRKHIEKKPDATYWSVSSNDSGYHCLCDECLKLDNMAEAPMGSLLTFVNKVAEQFPDKIISTLAYQYSTKAPKNIKPRDNVHIMMCNIEANRGKPFGICTEPGTVNNRNDLLSWKEICNNLFLWDYCIQFHNLVSPFPNLRVIGPNIRYFVENNVRSLFSQCNREYGGEFSDLRGYLLAKMMWNPYCDENEVIEDFVKGYYKQAAPYILEYINTMHDALDNSGGILKIFGGPEDAKNTYLTEDLFYKYCELFDKAQEIVYDDKEALFRVKTARLPLYYAGICLKYGTKEFRKEMIANFASQARKTGLIMVEEWSITVDQFVADQMAELAD